MVYHTLLYTRVEKLARTKHFYVHFTTVWNFLSLQSYEGGKDGSMSVVWTCMKLSFFFGFKSLNFKLEIWTSNLKIVFDLILNLFSNSDMCFSNSSSFFFVLKAFNLSISRLILEGDLGIMTVDKRVISGPNREHHSLIWSSRSCRDVG